MRYPYLRYASIAFAAAMITSLTACGGGSHGTLPTTALASATTAPSGSLVRATFTFVVPEPTTSAKTRKPKDISAATMSLRIHMSATDNATYPGAIDQLTQVSNTSGSSPGSPCTGGPPRTCTVAIFVPTGSDTFTFTTYDDTTGTGAGASHVLSQQQRQLAVVAGTANSFAVTFDGNAASMTVSGSGSCQNGAVGSLFGAVGTAPVSFNVAYADAAGQTVVGPGLPKLSVTATGVTGGTIGVSVNQAAQTYSLTPSAPGVSGTIAVQAVQADSTGSSDGLSFARTKSYTFASGNAPPAPWWSSSASAAARSICSRWRSVAAASPTRSAPSRRPPSRRRTRTAAPARRTSTTRWTSCSTARVTC